jgi:hypothetical protein
MNEYTVVGPTNFQPRFFRARDNAVAEGDTLATPDGCEDSPSLPNAVFGANDQKNSVSEPSVSMSSIALAALFIVASIFPL